MLHITSTCIPILLVYVLFGASGSLNDDAVFSEDSATDKLLVGLTSGNASELPSGHLKKLGEHDQPILNSITELDYMIGGNDFYEHFARKRRPVIFRNVTRNWMSTLQWKNQTYLLEKYPDLLFDVETGKVYDDALNTRKTMTMREFLAEYRHKTLYLDSPFPQTPMTRDMELPLMLQCEEHYKSFQSMHLLFSNGNTSSPLHHDGYENFLSVFSGIKVVYVIEPNYGKELYVEFVEDFPGLSPINPERVDFKKYPLFKGVPFHKVVLYPGDMLYIPQFWYHQVRSFESPNIAASMWFHVFLIQNMESLGYRDVLNIADRFNVSVESAPETIECHHQNRQMHELHDAAGDWIELRDFPEDKNDLPEINKVTLYDEVEPGQAVLYAGSDDSYIYAVNMVDGAVKWKLKTEQDTGSTCAFNRDGSLVYCGADDGRMRAMFTRNGTLSWQYKVGGAIISSVVVDDDENLYFGSLDNYMYSLTKDGEKRWYRYLGNQVWSTALLMSENDVLFIATKSGSGEKIVTAFALEMSSGMFVWRTTIKGGVIATPRFDTDRSVVYFCSLVGELIALNVTEGQMVFRVHLNDTEDLWASPVVAGNGFLYIILGSGRLIALDSSTREPLWERQLKIGDKNNNNTEDAVSNRSCNSSPLLASDGKLYVGSSAGIVYAIQPGNGDIIWQTSIGTGIFFSSPRLSKTGTLYIGSLDGPLYALDANNNGNVVWVMNTDKPFVGTALITRGFE